MRRALVAVAAALVGSGVGGAQAVNPAMLPEYRLDVTAFTGGQAGVGASIPASSYSRVGGVLGVGAVVDGAVTRTTARVELHGRFSADPFLEARYAPYVVAGGMVVCASDRRCRPLVVVRIGVEGPPRGGFVPGIELGLGDGVQVGFVVRHSKPGRR